ncbi:MAG TPA: GTP cyclohydrolase II [Streptomyces sp.]|nr:GTP cyclohydrolase II [Streptomyces sp.]
MPGTPAEALLSPVTVRARVPITLARANERDSELFTFHGLSDGAEHIACLVPPPAGAAGHDITPEKAPLVRLHSECLTGDVFGSERCDCGPQLDEALARMSTEGGVLLYLRQEGRGIGLYNKMDAYLLQDENFDTYEANRLIGRGADEREYAVAASMLHAMGLKRIRLLTNNPEKVRQLGESGIHVEKVVPTSVHRTEHNVRYLSTKAREGGHTLSVVEGEHA